MTKINIHFLSHSLFLSLSHTVATVHQPEKANSKNNIFIRVQVLRYSYDMFLLYVIALSSDAGCTLISRWKTISHEIYTSIWVRCPFSIIITVNSIITTQNNQRLRMVFSSYWLDDYFTSYVYCHVNTRLIVG